jgi:hypothetical protein
MGSVRFTVATFQHGFLNHSITHLELSQPKNNARSRNFRLQVLCGQILETVLTRNSRISLDNQQSTSYREFSGLSSKSKAITSSPFRKQPNSSSNNTKPISFNLSAKQTVLRPVSRNKVRRHKLKHNIMSG